MKKKYLHKCKYEFNERDYREMATATQCFFVLSLYIFLSVSSIVCLFFLDKTGNVNYLRCCIEVYIAGLFCAIFAQDGIAKCAYILDSKNNDVAGIIEFYDKHLTIKTKNSAKDYYYNYISKYRETKNYIYLKIFFIHRYIIIKKINCTPELLQFLKEQCKKRNKKIDKNFAKDFVEMEPVLYNEYESKSNLLYETNFFYDVKTVKDNYNILTNSYQKTFPLTSLFVSLLISVLISILIPKTDPKIILFDIFIIVSISLLILRKLSFKNLNEEKVLNLKKFEGKYIFFDKYFYVLTCFCFLKFDYDMYDECVENDLYIYMNSKLLNRHEIICKENCNEQLIEFLHDKYKNCYKKRV